MWRVVIAGKVQIAQQAAVVLPRLDSSHKWQLSLSRRTVYGVAKCRKWYRLKSNSARSFTWSLSRSKAGPVQFSCHYKLKARGPSLISVGMTRSFLDTSILYRVLPWLLLTTSVWPCAKHWIQICWACFRTSNYQVPRKCELGCPNSKKNKSTFSIQDT